MHKKKTPPPKQGRFLLVAIAGEGWRVGTRGIEGSAPPRSHRDMPLHGTPRLEDSLTLGAMMAGRMKLSTADWRFIYQRKWSNAERRQRQWWDRGQQPKPKRKKR